MMRNKTRLKYIVTLLIFIVSFSLTYAQSKDSILIKTAIPISLKYKHPLYSMYFTSSNSFFATTNEGGYEFIRKFSFEDDMIKDNGLVIPDTGVAIGGQINGLPYLYLQQKGDIIAGYPDNSPFSFTSYSEEVFVAGYLENQIVIVKQNGTLNLCKAIGTGDRVKYQKISISDPKKDENGIFILGDSLYFSRMDKTGFYKLYQSIYDRDIEEWGDPIMMSAPYNIEGSNTLFYVWYEDLQYISSDRDGILTIYAIGDKKVKNPLWDILVNNTKIDTLSMDEEYDHKLKVRIRDKTYEEYVSPNNYGFYNTIIDLTDEMHVVEDGDTIYILEVPKKDIRESSLNIVGRLKSKDGRNDIFMAENSRGEKFTLLPVEFAIKNGLVVDNNLVRKENLSKEDFILLNGIKYAAYGHSVLDPKKELLSHNKVLNTNNVHPSKLSKKEILQRKEELQKAWETRREFNADELLKLLGEENDTCYVQVGFYTKKQPNKTFWSMFEGVYNVLPSDRLLNKRRVGTQYTINLPFKEALIALNYTTKGFKSHKIYDKAFLRIGQWDSDYTIISLDNGRYVIESILINQE